LLRELTFQRETTRQCWPKRMIEILIQSRDHCEAARQAGKTALSAWRIQRIFRHYSAILDRALIRNPRAERQDKRRGRVKQSVAFNLINRMRDHADAVIDRRQRPTATPARGRSLGSADCALPIQRNECANRGIKRFDTSEGLVKIGARGVRARAQFARQRNIPTQPCECFHERELSTVAAA
jgi:hypothetical protein